MIRSTIPSTRSGARRRAVRLAAGTSRLAAAGLLVALGAVPPTAAFAQASSVTLYGIADVSVRHASGLNQFTPSEGSVSSVTGGVNNTSVFGFRGSEDLGGGLSAVFNLENGINMDTGTQAVASKFWDRQAWVGLQTAWGSVKLGRQRNLLGDMVSPVDPLGMRFASFNPNINVAALSQHRLGADYGSAGSTSGSYRLDNAVKLSGKAGGFQAHAMASAGEGSSGRSLSLGGGYTGGPLTVTGAYGRFETLDDLDLEAWLVGAGYQLGSARLTLTYGDQEGDTSATERTRQRTLGAGVSLPLGGKLELVTAYYRVERERTGLADDGFDRGVVFLEHALSKRTKLYTELDATRWRDGYQGPDAKDDAYGLSAGIVHRF